MQDDRVRLLLLADSHLGIDLPRAPRVVRRRRGDDFARNYRRVVDRALRGDVDLVVHGGDLLYRSKVAAWLTEAAIAPLRELADRGVPVCLVPGNHERSRIPHPLLALYPGIHAFDRPRTVTVTVRGLRVAVTGFPFQRERARQRFPTLIAAAGQGDAEVRLLCLHQCVEGARVGPSDYTFRDGDDVIAAADLPAGFAAVLAGHIHRHQILTRDPGGRPLAAPVFYPGSIERTSFAERDEEKGYLLIDLCAGDRPGGRVADWQFCPLPARPMIAVTLSAAGLDAAALRRRLERALADAPPDAVVRLSLRGQPAAGAESVLAAASLRALAPPTMNLSLSFGLRPAR